MKKALILLDERLKMQYKEGDYEFVANIHDEFQIEVKEEYAEDIASHAAESIHRAGQINELMMLTTIKLKQGSMLGCLLLLVKIVD